MVASSCESKAAKPEFFAQKVCNEAYTGRHSSQMFYEGRSFSGFERNPVWLNSGDASFVTFSALSGADTPLDSRAVLACDFDDDMDVDLFVHNIQRERHLLYRNELGGRGNGALALRLRATTGQWEAIGATVVVSTEKGRTAQVLSRGAGFISCQAPELVFGIGSAEEARVEVLWPGGEREDFGDLARGTRALLVEDEGVAKEIAACAGPLPDPLPIGLNVRIGEDLPALDLLDERGRSASVDVRAAADGKPLYLNLWASTCAPCVGELDDLERIAAEGERAVLLVSVDPPEARTSAAAQLEKRAPSLTSYYLCEGGSGLEAIADLVRLPIPTTLDLDADGRVKAILRGVVRSR